MEIKMLNTEKRNEKSTHIDKMNTLDMVKLVVTANYDAVKATEDASESIARAVDVVADALGSGHRLFYIGAGTSGRLGIMDATECPPTYGVAQDMFTGIIAGGRESVFRASEGAEDALKAGADDLVENGVKAGDVVIGISVAGNAEYVYGALLKAKELGAHTIGLTSNYGTLVYDNADIGICTDTGAEVITGSTRMKAGTAHKIVLNAISTCAMIKLGKVYENLMINLHAKNKKLEKRMINIVCEILKCSLEKAQELLEKNDWNVRNAVESVKGV